MKEEEIISRLLSNRKKSAFILGLVMFLLFWVTPWWRGPASEPGISPIDRLGGYWAAVAYFLPFAILPNLIFYFTMMRPLISDKKANNIVVCHSKILSLKNKGTYQLIKILTESKTIKKLRIDNDFLSTTIQVDEEYIIKYLPESKLIIDYKSA